MADVIFVFARDAGDEIYGGERSSMATAEALAAAGLDPLFIVTTNDGLTRELERRGLRYEIVPVGDPLTGLRGAGLRGFASRLLQIGSANLQTWRIVRRHRARLVHASKLNALFVAGVGGRLAHAKIIFHERAMSLRTRLPQLLGALLAHRTVTVSPSLRDHFVGDAPSPFRPYLRKRVRAIYNGFDFAAIDRFLAASSRAEARAALGVDEDDVLALLVGRIGTDKRQLEFLNDAFPSAAAGAPRLIVELVGGEESAEYGALCRQAVERRGLGDRVRWSGYLQPDEVFLRYRAADLLILPSWREGLPRAAVEGAAFGLPAVASAAVGSVDAIRQGETGYLVPVDRVAEMAPPIVALASDRALRERMGAAAAAFVRAEFSLDRNARELRELYRELTRD